MEGGHRVASAQDPARLSPAPTQPSSQTVLGEETNLQKVGEGAQERAKRAQRMVGGLFEQ